ncbi:MAG TPA: hypothetical protein PK317_04780 [Coprothermobacter proteolyticus]|nr:hypothetical protein [Coprothermobacter proteolyticus]
MSIYEPPVWQPDAVPTPFGWKHPTRNEILVSVKLDMSLYEKKEDVSSTSVDTNEKTTPEVEVIPVVPPKKSTKKKNV